MDWSILKDPGVWGVFVAAVALILSQFPPISDLIKGVKIKITVPGQFTLYHFIGNIQIYLLIGIHNIGGRSVSISRLECFITDDQRHIWHLPAQTYTSRQQSYQSNVLQEFLLGLISLKPGEQWNEAVRCCRLWSETEEEKANEIISQVTKSISSKCPSANSQIQVEADEKPVGEAISFFEKLFDLHKGNFKFFIAALSEDNSVLAVRSFDFTLFESNINVLRSHTDQYKYGYGIYSPVSDWTKYVVVRLRPIPDDKRTLETYEKLRAGVG